MHVIVVGCGRVGRELSADLESAGHSVVVVDKDARAFDGLPPSFAGRTVHGSGFDRNDLEAAGIREAGAVAAVTSGDNTNILCARIARESFEVENVVARIYDPRRAVIYQRLGIPTVATVSWTTEQVMRRLDPSRPAREWTDATGSVVLVERQLPDAWVGRTLEPIDELPGVRLAAVRRNGAATVATRGAVGQSGDLVYLAVEEGALGDLDIRLELGVDAGAHA